MHYTGVVHYELIWTMLKTINDKHCSAHTHFVLKCLLKYEMSTNYTDTYSNGSMLNSISRILLLLFIKKLIKVA